MARPTLLEQKRKQVYDKCGGRCAYCGVELAYSVMAVDHYIPMRFYESMIDKGDNPYDIHNLFPSCFPCHYAKRGMMPEKFRAMIPNWTLALRGSATYRNALRFGVVKEIKPEVQFYFEKIGVPACNFLGDFNNVLETKKTELKGGSCVLEITL